MVQGDGHANLGQTPSSHAFIGARRVSGAWRVRTGQPPRVKQRHNSNKQRKLAWHAHHFNAFASAQVLSDGVADASWETYELGGGAPEQQKRVLNQLPCEAKVVSYGWTDIKNPGCGPDSKEYETRAEPMEDGTYYDYTFYMIPTVYTLAPGHKLSLVLTTWDPYRAFLDEDYMLDTKQDPRYSFYTYGFVADNSSLAVRLPVR